MLRLLCSKSAYVRCMGDIGRKRRNRAIHGGRLQQLADRL